MERDESDEDFDRDGNPLSLEELDGWMNQVNKKMGELNDDDELEESINDQAREEEDDFATPINEGRRKK